MPLHKSEEGWQRVQARGLRTHRYRMSHRVFGMRQPVPALDDGLDSPLVLPVGVSSSQYPRHRRVVID